MVDEVAEDVNETGTGLHAASSAITFGEITTGLF